MEVTKEEFLAARKNVQEYFNTLSPLINEDKISYKNAQRGVSYIDYTQPLPDPVEDRSLLGPDLSEQTTLCCMALAHSHGRLHASKLHSKMEGHGVFFVTKEDQASYLQQELDKMEESQFPLIPGQGMRNMMRIVAFSERPVREVWVKKPKIEVPQEEFVTA